MEGGHCNAEIYNNFNAVELHVFITTSPFAQGAIKQDDVLMAFTFAQEVSKIGQVANGILKDVYGNGNDR